MIRRPLGRAVLRTESGRYQNVVAPLITRTRSEFALYYRNSPTLSRLSGPGDQGIPWWDPSVFPTYLWDPRYVTLPNLVEIPLSTNVETILNSAIFD